MAESKFDKFCKRIFDTQREGKGVEKKPRAPLTFLNFFKYYGENVTMIMKINFVLVFGNFPFLFALYALTGYLNTNSFGAASNMFGSLFGAMQLTGNYTPATMALYGVHGVQSTISLTTPATIVFFCLAGLVIFTMGPVKVATTYLLRSVVRGNPIFFFHDIKYAIKKNFWQAEILGIVDCLAYGIMAYNITLSYFNMGNMVSGIVFYANILLVLLYTLMRFYTYLMLVTFDLKTFKIYKNALIFAIINGKRNLMAVSGIAVCCAIVFIMIRIFLPVGVLLPFVLFFGTAAYMGCYAAYPKVKEIMIDPYYDSDEFKPEEPKFEDLD